MSERKERARRAAPLYGMQEEAGPEWVDAGESRFHLRPVYLVLAVLVVLAGVAAIVYPAVDLVDRFAPNLATEAFGILLTLVFVHRFLDQQDRARRLQGSIGALRKGSRAMRRLNDAWAVVVKGTLPHVPVDTPEDVAGLFAPHVTEHLSSGDPRAERADADGAGASWFGWAAGEFGAARDELSQIVVAYGPTLDPGYVEAVDDLIDDPFLRIFEAAAADASVDAREWRVRINRARAHREAHFVRLLWVLELHNSLAAEAARVRTRRMAPRTSLGIELDLDHDLKVATRLDAGWWRTAPRLGSLRATQDSLPTPTYS